MYALVLDACVCVCIDCVCHGMTDGALVPSHGHRVVVILCLSRGFYVDVVRPLMACMAAVGHGRKMVPLGEINSEIHNRRSMRIPSFRAFISSQTNIILPIDQAHQHQQQQPEEMRRRMRRRRQLRLKLRRFYSHHYPNIYDSDGAGGGGGGAKEMRRN